MSKQSSRKTRQTYKVNKELKRIRKERKIEALANSVRDFGDDAEMPCTHCFQDNQRCVMSPDSSRCEYYIQNRKSCDSTYVATSRKVDIIICLYIMLTYSLVITLIKQEKKLENNKDKASEDLLKLYKEMAALQSRLAAAAGCLSQIQKIKNRVRKKHSEATYRGLQEVKQQDNLLSILDAHKGALLEDLQADHVSNDVN
jgi:hypothetical protein